MGVVESHKVMRKSSVKLKTVKHHHIMQFLVPHIIQSSSNLTSLSHGDLQLVM